MWTIFKDLIDFVAVLLLYYVCLFFGHEAYVNVSFPTRDWTHIRCIGIHTHCLTTGLPGKSRNIFLSVFFMSPSFFLSFPLFFPSHSSLPLSGCLSLPPSSFFPSPPDKDLMLTVERTVHSYLSVKTKAWVIFTVGGSTPLYCLLSIMWDDPGDYSWIWILSLGVVLAPGPCTVLGEMKHSSPLVIYDFLK